MAKRKKSKSVQAGTAFRKWLREYLDATGMTNIQCAEHVGVNDSLIGHYLRGTRLPTLVTLQKFVDACDPDVERFFD